MYDFEITDVLRQKGIRKIEKQKETIAVTLSDTNKVIRSTIHKTDFDKSMKSLKKACSTHIDDKLVIEEIVMIISLKWDELIDDNDDNECSPRNVSANAIYNEIEKDKLLSETSPQKLGKPL